MRLTIDEAAARLGVSPGSLRVLHHRKPELGLQAPRSLWADSRKSEWDAAAIEEHLADGAIDARQTHFYPQHGLQLAEVLAGFGALAIAEATSPGSTELSFSRSTGGAMLTAEPTVLGEMLRDHAAKTKGSGWLTADDHAGRPLFGWNPHQPSASDLESRSELLKKMTPVELDLVDGIGMPGYPASPPLSSLPARNKGRYIAARLRQGAEYVAGLTATQVVDLLTEHRVSTPAPDLGMGRAPFDLLLGWLAIWGCCFFPTQWSSSGRQLDMGFGRDSGTLYVAIPIPTRWAGYGPLRAITCSPLLGQAAAGRDFTSLIDRPSRVIEQLWPGVCVVRWPFKVVQKGPIIRRLVRSDGHLIPASMGRPGQAADQ